MAKRAITVTNASVKFQMGRKVRRSAFEALHNVSMHLNHGEKLGIIGRNGAGKSTLLRMLAGVLRPDSGKIERDHGPCQLLALGAGFMPNLTGRENAVLSGLLQGMSRREVVSKLELIKEFSELGDFFDQPMKTYSTGMKTRLGFSVAIQQEPDILLIDETLAVGDSRFKAKTLDALTKRIKSGGTYVLVSHSERMVEELCDRVMWLDAGSLRESGDTGEILAKYRGCN